MSTHHRLITPEKLWDTLLQAGVLTREQHTGVRRIVIDAEVGRPVMMYLEQYADERLLAITLGLQGIEVHTQHGDNAGPSEEGERGIEGQDPEGTGSGRTEEQPDGTEHDERDDISPGML